MRLPRTPRSCPASPLLALGAPLLLVAVTAAGVAAPASAAPTTAGGTTAGTAQADRTWWRAAAYESRASSSAPTRGRAVTRRTTSMDPMAREVVRLTNVERAKVGCGALRIDSRLNTAARLHSEDMARYDYFSHTSRDGRTPGQRIAAQGYTAWSGENIAAGYADAASVMRGWMDSPGHRTNLLNCSHKAIGVGIGRGGSYSIYWTQNFGRT